MKIHLSNNHDLQTKMANIKRPSNNWGYSIRKTIQHFQNQHLQFTALLSQRKTLTNCNTAYIHENEEKSTRFKNIGPEAEKLKSTDKTHNFTNIDLPQVFKDQL